MTVLLLIVCAIAFVALCATHYYRERCWRLVRRVLRFVAVIRCLPHCIECGALATRVPSSRLGDAGKTIGPRCDEHRPPRQQSDPMVALDWAHALRDLQPGDLPTVIATKTELLPKPQILGVPVVTDDAETTPFSRAEFEEASRVVHLARAKKAKGGRRRTQPRRGASRSWPTSGTRRNPSARPSWCGATRAARRRRRKRGARRTSRRAVTRRSSSRARRDSGAWTGS